MHTVEIEHHPLAQRFPFLRRFQFMRSEDTVIATLASWTVGLVICTLAGFYFGSIAGHNNHPAGRHRDLDPAQLQAALPYAAGGLAVGLLFALAITFWYTPTKLRELESEQGHH